MSEPKILIDHDGRCTICGGVSPCEESDCMQSPGHEYDHPECYRRRPGRRAADELPEADFYGD